MRGTAAALTLATWLVLARPCPAPPPPWADSHPGWMSALLRGIGDADTVA